MRILIFCIFILLGVKISSCSKWNFEKKAFPKCTKPSATLSYTSNQLQVNFSLTSVTGNVDKVEWFYGDGKTNATTAHTIQYTYGSSGAYQVKVRLSNRCGDVTDLDLNLQVVNVTLPAVSTLDPKEIKINSATLGLILDSFGDGTVSKYGVCYSTTNAVPTLDNSLSVTLPLPARIGVPYDLEALNLTPNSIYYVRAFCQNSAGIAYGAIKTFQTGTLPTVTTLAVDKVNSTKALLSLTVNELGIPNLNQYGIMLSSETSDPGRSGSFNVYYYDTNENPSNLLGTTASFNVENLTPNTLYYYRAYAKNLAGTFYGQVYSFKTLSTISLDAGLIVYLPLNSSATDLSENNFITTMWGATANLGATDRKGVVNAAMNFNGIDNYIAIPDNSLLQTPEISVSFWAKPNNSSGKERMSIIGKSEYANSQHEQYSFGLNFSSNDYYTFSTSIKQNSDCITPGINWQYMSVGSFTSSVWQHMVYTFENGVGKLYANGVLMNTSSNYPSKVIDDCTGGNLRIGVWWKDFPDYYQGYLDEVRIYNRALNQEEVKALYNQ